MRALSLGRMIPTGKATLKSCYNNRENGVSYRSAASILCFYILYSRYRDENQTGGTCLFEQAPQAKQVLGIGGTSHVSYAAAIIIH